MPRHAWQSVPEAMAAAGEGRFSFQRRRRHQSSAALAMIAEHARRAAGLVLGFMDECRPWHLPP
jgi:hypothetical protein